MGKCTKLISKGKNAGKVCGAYTNKIINGNYICAGHYNAEKNKQIQPKEIKKPPIYQPELSIDLESGYSVDEIIEHQFNKNKDKYIDNTDLNLAKFNHVFDQIKIINKKLSEIENKNIENKNIVEEEQEFEEFH